MGIAAGAESRTLEECFEAVRARIDAAARAAGRDPGSVRLLAVTKTHSAALVRAAAMLGQRAFGENYLQEALPKLDALAALGLQWHFIGALQANKTRAVAEHFAWVHTVDRDRIARRLSEQRPARQAPLEVCIEVNVSGEASKAGVEPAALDALSDYVAGLPRLKLRGLMTLPEPGTDTALQRAGFRRLADLLARQNARGHTLDTLSMGTTGDLEAAIYEGATIVRVGTALFGPRAR